MASPVRSVLASAFVLALIVGAVGCGGDSDETATSTDATVAELQMCPSIGPEKEGNAQIAAGYNGTVNAISCREAGRYIVDHFIGAFDDTEARQMGHTYDQIAESRPGNFTSAGFACRHEPLEDGGGWALECQRDDQVVAFTFTP